MKRIKYYPLTVFAAWCIAYFIIGFIVNQWDATSWQIMYRVFMVILWGIGVLISALIKEEH